MSARFPHVPLARGFYESFYLRACSPTEPLGVWIRCTVHKRAGAFPQGSVWFTWFDPRHQAPLQYKQTSSGPRVPAEGWIEIDGTSIGCKHAEGACGAARFSLRITGQAEELRHLPWDWLYRSPLPRTKLTSPAPLASFDGTLELAGQAIELRGWPGMVGHNWGSEHAERWIWLHGLGFAEDRDAWLDVAFGRILLAGRPTPWVGNGALALSGVRHRLGGLGARGLCVSERPGGAELSIPGADGLRLTARVRTPSDGIAGWRYADPDGGEHEVANCSVAALELTVHRPGRSPVALHSDHGTAYELGMREHDHGIPIAPFADG